MNDTSVTVTAKLTILQISSICAKCAHAAFFFFFYQNVNFLQMKLDDIQKMFACLFSFNVCIHVIKTSVAHVNNTLVNWHSFGLKFIDENVFSFQFSTPFFPFPSPLRYYYHSCK